MLGKKTKGTDETTTQQPRPRPTTDAGTSVVSKQMRIDGDCVVEGAIRIEGRISGSVRAAALELTESGSVEGDLSAAGDAKSARAFVIGGRVDGEVRAPRVEISPTGAVLRGVVADEVNVRGRIEGGILARRRLVLEETAVVEGDVRALKLALKEGGQVNGTIVMGDRAAEETSSSVASAGSRSESSESTPRSREASSKERAPEERASKRPKPDSSDADADSGEEILARTGAKDAG